MALAPTPQQLVRKTILVGETSVQVEVADAEGARKRGLSGRDLLGENEGMLFVFGRDEAWGIWMKDMRFAIDIVWLSSESAVLSIAPDVSPETYPKVFYPSTPARYVLELPAGFVAAHALAIGSKVVVE